MKKVLIIALLLVSILFSLSGFAQDYMKWGIPGNATFRLGKGQIYDLKHSPNGDLIAVATSIGVWLYDAHSGKEIRLLQKHIESVNSLVFSPNGKVLASCGRDGIHLWEPDTGRHLSTFKESSASVRDLVFSPDGRTLVSTSDRIIRFWDVRNGTISKTLTGHTREILSIAVSPNGKIIVSGSLVHDEKEKSNGLRWWDVETGRTMFFSTNVNSVTALAFSPDGTVLACADGVLDSDGVKIHLFHGVNGQILKTLRGQKSKITTLAFSPDGKMLASSGWDNTISLWDSRSGHYIHTFRGHTSGVRKASFSPDGETLVSGSEDGTIRFWDTSTKQQSFSVSGHWDGVDALAFSTDSKTLVSGIPDATIHKWDVNTGQLMSTLIGRYGERILAFDMKGRVFASRSSYLEKDKKIYIRHIDTGKSRTSMDLGKFSHEEKTTFSHDGGTLILTHWNVGGADNAVQFWETFTQHLKFEFVPYENHKVDALVSSPNGTLLAIATGRIVGTRVSIWKFGTNEFIRLYPAEFGFLMCEALAFSDDSKTLAIGDSWDIRLIEVDTGHLITTLSKHNGRVKALAFSPNGKILASGSEDGTILIWDLDKIMKSQ